MDARLQTGAEAMTAACRKRWLLAVVLLAFSFAVASRMLPRYQAVAPDGSSFPSERLANQIDPWLLGERFSHQLVVEIDWIEGCKPGPQAVAGLKSILTKYSSHHNVEIVNDTEIPRAEWDNLGSMPNRFDRLVQKYAGIERASAPGTEWRYVLFVPDAGGNFGQAFTWLVERGEDTVLVSGLVVSRTAHDKYAVLWIDRDRLERMTLIHEFGHLLGLVGNPRHERRDPAHRLHCTSLTCAMAHPTWRVIARNLFAGIFNQFLDDYCVDCQADIRRAQAYWRDREAEGSAYRERRERERAASLAAVSLQGFARNKNYKEMLRRARKLRSTWPESPGWDEVEAQALIGLGRIDDALLLQVRTLPKDPLAPTYWRSRWNLAPLYVSVGRYDDTIALFDRTALANAEEADFEQCVFVLEKALTSCERYDDAVALLDELLARDHPVSFQPERMRTRRAGLLRRAGRLREADDAVAAGLSDPKVRAFWLEEAARLRRAQGRAADEQALWQELLQGAEESVAATKGSSDRTALQWSIVQSLARLDRIDEARARAASIQDAPSSEENPRYRLYTELPARAAIGDFDRVAELIRAVPSVNRAYNDPCQMEDLAPMRDVPKYDDIFKMCPRTRDKLR